MVETMSNSPSAKLLLVDDDANVLEALARMLRIPGYELCCTTDPRVAMDYLSKRHLTLVR